MSEVRRRVLHSGGSTNRSLTAIVVLPLRVPDIVENLNRGCWRIGLSAFSSHSVEPIRVRLTKDGYVDGNLNGIQIEHSISLILPSASTCNHEPCLAGPSRDAAHRNDYLPISL
jgi:hypothetical protein